MSDFLSLKLRVGTLLLLCFTFIDSLYSQSIFTQGHYDYSFNGELVYGVSEIDYITRYSLNSDSIYVFSRKGSLKDFDSDDIRESLLDTMFVIGSDPDSLVVKFRSDGEERLFYDFNLEVGSTYKIYPDRLAAPGSDSMDVTILGYGDTLISGQIIPYQTVQYTFDDVPYTITDNLYQGIGSLRYYFDIFDIFGNLIGSGIGGPLVCYNNQELDYINDELQSDYINELSGQCIGTSGEVNARGSEIVIYPNPCYDYLDIDFNDDIQLGQFLIISSLGVRYDAPFEKQRPDKYHVDVRILPDGIFYLAVHGKLYRFLKL